jgi:hypothetical protein
LTVPWREENELGIAPKKREIAPKVVKNPE